MYKIKNKFYAIHAELAVKKYFQRNFSDERTISVWLSSPWKTGKMF